MIIILFVLLATSTFNKGSDNSNSSNPNHFQSSSVACRVRRKRDLDLIEQHRTAHPDTQDTLPDKTTPAPLPDNIDRLKSSEPCVSGPVQPKKPREHSSDIYEKIRTARARRNYQADSAEKEPVVVAALVVPPQDKEGKSDERTQPQYQHRQAAEQIAQPLVGVNPGSGGGDDDDFNGQRKTSSHTRSKYKKRFKGDLLFLGEQHRKDSDVNLSDSDNYSEPGSAIPSGVASTTSSKASSQDDNY